MVRRQHPAQDVDLVLAADLPNDVTHPQAHITSQHLVAIVSRPDDVVAMIENAAFLSAPILEVAPLPNGFGLVVDVASDDETYITHKEPTTY